MVFYPFSFIQSPAKILFVFLRYFILIQIFSLMLFLAPKPYEERNQPIQVSC